MNLKIFRRSFALLSIFYAGCVFGQNVPQGIFYQAVARDSYGKELVNKNISVRFSVITDNPLGTVVYQELHDHVTTSKFGVFSLVVGRGTSLGSVYNDFSQIQWSRAYHYLKVEVKFDNDFMDMGTMQFLTVPYALYAQKSLEPGPAGPKGDPGPKGEAGDPATDNQTLSFDQSNLTISGGNTIPMTSLLQNLTITTTPEGNYLGISRGNSVLLSNAEADGDPTNEIQDLTINSDKLRITRNPLATEWDLSRYLDNTDNQSLLWDAATRKLGISGNSGQIDLSELKNDADADPANELQNLSFNQSTNTLSISNGNSVSLGNTIAFRARKIVSETGLSLSTDYDFITPVIDYNDGSGFDGTTGVFTAPVAGIYTFVIGYSSSMLGNARELRISLNGTIYETLNTDINASSALTRSVTLKLNVSDKVKILYNRGTSTESGTGSFSGYKVN